MTSETFDRPGWLGRLIRMSAGMFFLALLIITLIDPKVWISDTMPRSLGLWIGAVLCFRFLSGMEKGFSQTWGRAPQLIFASFALVAIVYNFVQYGTWWSIPLGVLFFVLVVYVSAHLGVSFLLAGIIAHPG